MQNDDPNKPNQPTEPVEPVTPEPSPASGTIEPEPEPHRYSESDAPYSWAVGKTDREVMDVANQVMESMKTWEKPATAPAPYEPPRYNEMGHNMSPTTVVNVGPVMPDPDAYLGDTARYQRDMTAFLDARDEKQATRIAEQMQQQLQPQIQTLGAIARENVARDPEFSRIFERFGHEVDQEFLNNNVPMQNRTPDAYKMIAHVIRSRHYKELAREDAEKFLTVGGGTGTVRTTGGGPMDSEPHGDALDQIWDDPDHRYIKALRDEGLSKQQVRETANKLGHTVDAYVKLMSGDGVFRAPDGKYLTMNRTVAK